MSEKLPFEAKSALHTAAVSAGRATYVAAFAYYEIGEGAALGLKHHTCS